MQRMALPRRFVTNLAVINDELIYTLQNGQLVSRVTSSNAIKIPLTNVVWMVPSVDEKQLAIVRRIKSGAMELLITDLRGNILSAIAQDSQIYGAAWSPNGTKLAYSSIKPNGTVRGIYVADTATGLSSHLSVDVKFIADPIRWSPTGNQIMITSAQPSNWPNEFVTFLVRVGG